MSAAGTAARPAGRMAGRLQTIVVIAIAAVVLGVLAWSATGAGMTDGVTKVELPANAAAKAPAPGEVPPAFSGVTYDGKAVSLADYAGHPVWLTFGATWCPDCRVEMADLQATYAANQPGGLVVLAVFVNESAQDIGSYVTRSGLTFPITVDENADIAAAYRNVGLPTHYFIKADGTISEIRIGSLSKDDMARAVAAIMN